LNTFVGALVELAGWYNENILTIIRARRRRERLSSNIVEDACVTCSLTAWSFYSMISIHGLDIDINGGSTTLLCNKFYDKEANSANVRGFDGSTQ